MTPPPLQYQCLHCGGWFLLASSTLRCRERAIPTVQAESAAKRAAYEWSRLQRQQQGVAWGSKVRVVK